MRAIFLFYISLNLIIEVRNVSYITCWNEKVNTKVVLGNFTL
jgi:hypothetical protein